jgi:hypothetical protein
LLIAIAASPAAAIDDLSGVWEGKFSCDATSPTTTSLRDKPDATLYLEDRGDGTGRARFNNVTVFPIPVTIVSGADKPGLGRLAGVMCGFDADTGGILVQGRASLKPGSEKGTLTGEVISFVAQQVSICRFKVKRRGPLPGPVGDCPP